MKPAFGLTGGIGSGKSLVAKVFEHLGVGVFYSDSEAKGLYSDAAFLEEICAEFGSDIVKDGVFQPKRLAEKVFSDKKKLSRLNAMVHPKVFELFDAWKQRQASSYVIMESAVIFENGLQSRFSGVISVSAPRDVVIQRVIARDCCTWQDVLRRLENQMAQEKKDSLSDFVITHDGKTMLLPQILQVHTRIEELCIHKDVTSKE